MIISIIRCFIITLSVLCLSQLSFAAIYKWVDQNGKTQFSDIPPNNADSEQVNLNQPNGNSYSPSANNLIINKNNKTKETSINKKIDEYKKIKEHHMDEDISPYLQDLDQKLEQNTQGSIKLQNCQIAKNNYNKLLDLFNNKNILNKNKEPKLALNKQNKLTKLSKTEIKTNLKIAKKNLVKYCLS